MKYNLRKKKRAWDLFRNEMKTLIGICISFTLGITVWLNWITIIKLFDWLNLKPIDFLAYFIALPFIILFMMSYLTTVIKYLYRHLYIPLTHEELEANNIHTLEEYVNFLSCLFMGSCPLKRVQNEIKQTAKELNAKSNKTLNHFFKYDNLVIVYGVCILIMIGISLAFGIRQKTFSFISFICSLASLLLISHFGIILIERNLDVWTDNVYNACDCNVYNACDCSVFKIARIKERHLKEESK